LHILHKLVLLLGLGERDNIIARVAALKTRSDAATYLASVAAKRNAARAASATAGGKL
jgi:hypothetical protein